MVGHAVQVALEHRFERGEDARHAEANHPGRGTSQDPDLAIRCAWQESRSNKKTRDKPVTGTEAVRLTRLVGLRS